MLVVTIREGEERGMCNAALRELLRISKDQTGERSVVVIVLSKRSTIWKKTSMRTLIRQEQLRYIDVEEMRVVTNDKHIAEQIKIVKMESVVMNGVRSGKVGKLEKCNSDEGMLSLNEKRLCRSIIKGLARRNHERHTMLADVEEEQEQDVMLRRHLRQGVAVACSASSSRIGIEVFA